MPLMRYSLSGRSVLHVLVFLLLSVLGQGVAWGENRTVTLSYSQVKGLGKSGGDFDGAAAFDYEVNPICFSFSNAYGSEEHIKVYASSTITITGPAISKVVITALDDEYIRTWTANSGNVSVSKAKATWQGSEDSVTLKNKSSSQARILKIEVTCDAPKLTGIKIVGPALNTEYYVDDTPSVEGLGVVATYEGDTEDYVTDDVEWDISPRSISRETQRVEVRAIYGGMMSDSYSYDIKVISIANDVASAYSVSTACLYTDNGKGLSEDVYVTGIVSQTEFIEEGMITYFISDDGTTNHTQFACRSGLDIDVGVFAAINDLKLGTRVVVRGKLQKTDGVYGFKENSVIVSKDETNAREILSLSISGTPLKTTYKVGDVPSADGYVVTALYSDGTELDVTEKVDWTFEPSQIVEGTTDVISTAVYRGYFSKTEYKVSVDTETWFYEMTPIAGGSLQYGVASEIVVDGIGWNVCGNTRSYGTWALGGKSIKNTNRDIITLNPIWGEVAKVTVCVGKTSGNITFNSLSLTVADNSSFSNSKKYTIVSPSPNTDYTFEITSATDAYYKVTYNLTVGSSNKYIAFDGIKFFGKQKSFDMPMSSAGYSTLCLPYSARVPDGVTVYTAIDAGNVVLLSPKESPVVVAGEGLVLKGNEGNYKFVQTFGNFEKEKGNQLVGTISSIALSESDNAYLLARKKGTTEVAFYRLATKYTMLPNKAYLKLPSANSRAMIPVLWDDEATGVLDVWEELEEASDIYNLSGQRLSKPQKGINIVNGRLLVK